MEHNGLKCSTRWLKIKYALATFDLVVYWGPSTLKLPKVPCRDSTLTTEIQTLADFAAQPDVFEIQKLLKIGKSSNPQNDHRLTLNT